MNQAYIVDVQQLTKSFNRNLVVDNLSIRIKAGEIFGFLGANGSGKTTTIRMICGLLTPDAASGHCLGYDLVRESREIKKNVGYMPQRFSLYLDLSVYENLAFIAQIYGIEEAYARIENVIKRLKLQDKIGKLAGELSGGWKQRLAFATCLIHQPKLLLLDEPTSGIDPLARRDFWDIIHELSESGVTTLISTHYMDEALRCDRLAYLSNGRLLVSGRIAEVISATNIHTFNLMGALPSRLLGHLKQLNMVIQAAWFGQSVHVCTYEPEALILELTHLSQEYGFSFEQVNPSLEDAFIALGGQR